MEKFLIGMTILLVAGFVVLIWYAAKEDAEEARQWAVFQAEHNCHIVAHIKGKPSVGYTSAGKGGVVVTQEPDKTGWLCDDGVTYYR